MIEILETDNIDDGREKENENFTECGNHIADESIHVTPAKTETWDETGADLTAHMTDHNNPHGVTPAQIGAAAASDLASALDARGGKNLLLNRCQALTAYGVTATINDDGDIVLNGTATSNGILYANIETGQSNLSLQYGTKRWFTNGDYVAGSGIGGVRIQIFPYNGAGDYGAVQQSAFDGSATSITINDIYAYNHARLYITSGSVFDNAVVRPYVVPKDLYDISPDYVPYSPTTSDLQKQIDALTARIAALEA